MTLDEVLELAGGLVLSIALGAFVAAAVPAPWTWPAGLAALGLALLLLSLLNKRATRPVVKDLGDTSRLPGGRINIGRSDS